jgi:small-conductance mechanosensitive channel
VGHCRRPQRGDADRGPSGAALPIAQALEVEVVYWVLSGDYTVYMDCQQAINFAIFRAFEEEGIEFAFPSQTLYVPSLESALDAMANGAKKEAPTAQS